MLVALVFKSSIVNSPLLGISSFAFLIEKRILLICFLSFSLNSFPNNFFDILLQYGLTHKEIPQSA